MGGSICGVGPLGDPEAVREALRREVVPSLADAAVGLVIDESGGVHQGRPAAAGPAHGAAGGGQRVGGVQKPSADPPGGQPLGGVQGPPRPPLPLSVPDMGRLWWHLVLGVEQTARHRLA
jgi:hypothetical protein